MYDEIDDMLLTDSLSVSTFSTAVSVEWCVRYADWRHGRRSAADKTIHWRMLDTTGKLACRTVYRLLEHFRHLSYMSDWWSNNCSDSDPFKTSKCDKLQCKQMSITSTVIVHQPLLQRQIINEYTVYESYIRENAMMYASLS